MSTCYRSKKTLDERLPNPVQPKRSSIIRCRHQAKCTSLAFDRFVKLCTPAGSRAATSSVSCPAVIKASRLPLVDPSIAEWNLEASSRACCSSGRCSSSDGTSFYPAGRLVLAGCTRHRTCRLNSNRDKFEPSTLQAVCSSIRRLISALTIAGPCFHRASSMRT